MSQLLTHKYKQTIVTATYTTLSETDTIIDENGTIIVHCFCCFGGQNKVVKRLFLDCNSLFYHETDQMYVFFLSIIRPFWIPQPYLK